MRRRRFAFAMAVMMAFTSIPTNGYHVHAEDVIAEDLIIEDAGITEEYLNDSDVETSADDDEMVTNVSPVDDALQGYADGENVLDAGDTAEEQSEILSEDEILMSVETVQSMELLEDDNTESESSGIPSVTGMTVVSAPDLDIFVENADSYYRYYSGCTVNMTYSDGTSQNIDIFEGAGDSYGNIISYDIYTPTETGTCKEVVSDKNNLQPGNYIRKVSFGEYSYEYPMQIISLSDAAGTNQIDTDSNSSITFSALSAGGHTPVVSFTPNETREYCFYALCGDYLKIFTEDGTAYAAASVDSLNIILFAETKYYIAFRNGLSAQQEITLSVREAKTPQSVSVSGTLAEIDVYRLYEYLPTLCVTVSYNDLDTEQVSEWNFCGFTDDTDENTMLLGMLGYTANGDVIYLKMYDSNGNHVSMPNSSGAAYTFMASDSYTIQAELAGYPEIAENTYTFNVNGPDKSAVNLSKETETIYNLEKDGNQWFAFTADSDGKYLLEISYCSNDQTEFTYPSSAVYKEAETGIQYDESSSRYYDSEQIIEKVTLREGETCYLLLHAVDTQYGSSSIQVKEAKEIIALDIEAEDEYTPGFMDGILRYIPLTVTYNDGTTEEIEYWTNERWESDESGTGSRTAYTVTTKNRDTIYLEMQKDGEIVSLPGVSDFYETGTYILRAYAEDNESVYSEEEFTILDIPEDASELVADTETGFSVSDDTYAWFVFKPQESGKYTLGFEALEADTTGDMVLAFNVYEKDGEKIKACLGTLLHESYCEFEAGKTYVLLFEVLSGSGTYAGTVEVHKQNKIAGISFSQTSYDMEFASVYSEILNIPVEVSYDDGSTQLISDWVYGGILSEDGTYKYALSADAGDDQYIMLYLTDESGALADVPYADNEIKFGSFKMHVHVTDDETITAER